MFCGNCGGQVSDVAVFCSSCGNRVRNAAPVAEPVYQEPVAEPVYYEPEPEVVYQEPEPVYYEPEPEIIYQEPEPVYHTPESVQQPEVFDHIIQPAPEPVYHAQEPVYHAPVAAVIEPVIEKSSPAGTAVKVIVSILLGILIFGLTIAFVSLFLIRPANIVSIVENTDISWIVEEAGISEELVSDINDFLPDHIYIDVDGIQEFTKRSSVSTEVGIVINRYVRAIAEGNLDYHISPREVISFIRAIAPELEDEFGYEITSEDYDSINEALTTDFDLKEFSAATVLEEAGLDQIMPYTLFSIYPFIIIGILCALIVLNLVLLHRKKVRNSFLALSIPFIISGIILTSAALLLGPMSGMIRSYVAFDYARITSGVADVLLLPSLICFAAGLCFLVIYIILSSIKRKTPQLPSIPGDRYKAVWRISGALLNAVLLISCFAFSLLYYTNLP